MRRVYPREGATKREIAIEVTGRTFTLYCDHPNCLAAIGPFPIPYRSANGGHLFQQRMSSQLGVLEHGWYTEQGWYSHNRKHTVCPDHADEWQAWRLKWEAAVEARSAYIMREESRIASVASHRWPLPKCPDGSGP